MKYTLRLFAAVSIAAVSISLSACVSSSGNGGIDGDEIKIGFVPGATTAQFWTAMKNGAQDKADELGVELIWQGDPEYSVAAQTPVLNSVAASNLDALIVAPTDPEAMFAPINAIAESGAKIVLVDSKLDDLSIVEAQVYSDNEQGGAVAAEQYVESAGATGTVAVIGLTPEATTVNARIKGFVDKLTEIAPDIQILPTQYADGEPATQDVFQSMLVSNPDLTGVFVPSSTGAGAAAAVKAQGRENILIIDYDSSEGQVQLLNNGEIGALVLQQPAEQGAVAVQAAYDAVMGKKPQVETLVPTVIATTDNANDPDVKRYFY